MLAKGTACRQGSKLQASHSCATVQASDAALRYATSRILTAQPNPLACPLLRPCTVTWQGYGRGQRQRLGIKSDRRPRPAPFTFPAVAALTAAADDFGASSRHAGVSQHEHLHVATHRKVRTLLSAFSHQLRKFTSLSGKFTLMVALFFTLAFVNTILDSLKDTLVITASTGGAQVIPYLTVYAVLPSSLVFLLLYSIASQRMSRSTVFNTVLGFFMAFFAAFGLVLYPRHDDLHLHQLADSMAQVLPSGLSGLVGMVRNWVFTLFYCVAELWGDVSLGLLFYQLANDTTSLSEARTIYPLFGLGANVAQASAGAFLKAFSSSCAGGSGFCTQIQVLMLAVFCFSAVAIALHAYIDHTEAERLRHKASVQATKAAARATAATAEAIPPPSMPTIMTQLALEARERRDMESMYFGNLMLHENLLSVWDEQEDTAAPAAGGQAARSTLNSTGAGSPTEASTIQAGRQAAAASTDAQREKQSIIQIFQTLAMSTPIQCLAVMSLSMGLCSNLLEFAWKSHIRLLFPSPSEFAAFLGEVSTWQGLLTGSLMVASPAIFERFGWRGVASITPRVLLLAGSCFLAACGVYQYFFSHSAAAAASGTSHAFLAVLVYSGAAAVIFCRSAKFSCQRPAEEMVYISLDEQSRTKGKAAVGVVGTSLGKSSGSILQQLLLVLSSGAMAHSLPVMLGMFMMISGSWLRSVSHLADHNPRYGHPDSVHISLTATTDDESEPLASSAAKA